MASNTKELLGFLFLVVALLECFQAAPVSDRLAEVKKNLKRDFADGYLPRWVTPSHYDVEITPDVYSSTEPPFSFSGAVRIYVNCTGNTDIVILNVNKLDIIGVDIRNDPANAVQPPSPILLEWTLDADSNFLLMRVANALEYGSLYLIYAYFVGTMTNNDVGLNYQSYTDLDGTTKFTVFSALQDLGARRVFPCFDEPDLKATFNITILSQPPMKTISNMPEIDTEVRGAYIAHYFAETPRMSTYQVAIIVGEFVAVPVSWEGITTYPITIYARPQVTRQLAFAASIVAPLQKWFEDSTGVPYPLPKMDHIVLPVDEWELENWGAISYGESYFLINPEFSGAGGRLRVARTIAHELAHQWFGNLVTFKTYEDVWIREGFSQHYGYRALDAIGWPGRELQQADDIEGTLDFLNYDSLNTSDPVRKEVPTIWDAAEAAEGSTYQKGGAIVRQLQGILTTSTFRTAITNFLVKYAYDSVTTEDLWEVISEQAALDGRPVDIGNVTDAWLNQWGYPLVFVYDNTNGTATALPRHYLSPSGQSATTPSPYNYQWDIPVTVLTSSTQDLDGGATQWIPSGAQRFHITGIPTAPGEWFLLNTNQNFFYRVDYDLTNRANIDNQFQTGHTVIPTETRCQHLDDTFQLAEALNTISTVAMDLSKYLTNEVEYGPWHVSLRHLRVFDRLLQGYLWYGNYKIYMSSLVLPAYNRLGWDYDASENPFQQLLRRDVLINACYYGLSDCYDRALTEYSAYKADPEARTTDPNNLPTVLCSGVASGDGSDWSFVLQQYQSRVQSSVIEDRYAFLFALACSSDTIWLERYLSYIIQGTVIATRDKDVAMFFLAQNRVGLPIVRDYLYNSWSTIPDTISKLDRLSEVTRTFTSFLDNIQFNNFVALHPPATSYEKDRFLQMDRVILQNLDWIETNEFPLQNWLNDNIPTSPPEAKLSNMQLPISPMAHSDSIKKFK